MTAKPKKDQPEQGAKKTREERLREALRVNLQRRKAQDRARKALGTGSKD